MLQVKVISTHSTTYANRIGELVSFYSENMCIVRFTAILCGKFSSWEKSFNINDLELL